MAKGYWIATVDFEDLPGMKLYSAANREPMGRYGAKFVVRHGRQRVAEGNSRSRQVIVEFASYEDAIAAYDDPQYQAAVKLRQAASKADLVIVEGFDGEQPFQSKTSAA